jgi:spore coat polysaccharide biosynthesis protein SpsF
MPQKVMLSLVGRPLLYRIWERVKASKNSGEVVVITSESKDDDKIEQFCKSENINCYRGHLTDLLDRHYQAGKLYNADAVVKIPSDCPLIDPAIIDEVIGHYLKGITHQIVWHSFIINFNKICQFPTNNLF